MTGLRYNPSGILSSAAATIGQMGSYGQQRASDMALIQQQSAQQNQSDEFAQQQQQEATRLQQAGQLAMQRQNQTLTNANANAGQSPFTQAILKAKKFAALSAAGTLTDPENAAFGADSQNPTGSAEDFQTKLAKAVAAHQNTAAKAQVVDAAKDQVDPEDAPLISGMAADPQYSAAHVMQAIQQSMQKKAKKAQVAQDIAAKQSVIQTAQNDKNLTDDDRSAIAPLANDPNTNAQQLQSKVASLRAQNQRTGQMAEGQKLQSARSAMAALRKDAAVMKADPKNEDLFNGDPNLPPDRQEALKEYNDLNTRAKQIRDNMASQALQSYVNPSTNHRILKLKDGSVVDAETLDPITREE